MYIDPDPNILVALQRKLSRVILHHVTTHIVERGKIGEEAS
jgi:hypothetical protein